MPEHFPKMKLHPATIKALKSGHPWVTLDSFSARFPKNDLFIIGVDQNGKEVATLINDPEHPEIKARLWGLKPLKQNDFKKDLEFRLTKALEKRSADLKKERENYYLVFSEADLLPGLFIQHMKDTLLVQYYSSFWKKIETTWLSVFEKVYGEEKKIWIQERNKTQTVDFRSEKNAPCEFVLKEFSLNYKIELNSNYDYGIYTDMSSMRKRLAPFLKEGMKVLNLFCYTGAYSLFALSQKVESVTSVDLSKKYLDWLEENLKLNPTLPSSKHRCINLSTMKALSEFEKKGETFDFIICDPPSASSDGIKVQSAYKAYDEMIPKLAKSLSPNGQVLLFLNTHHISFFKWREKVKTYCQRERFEIIKEFHLEDDCPRLKNFPEGDYLKGILLKKVL